MFLATPAVRSRNGVSSACDAVAWSEVPFLNVTLPSSESSWRFPVDGRVAFPPSLFYEPCPCVVGLGILLASSLRIEAFFAPSRHTES